MADKTINVDIVDRSVPIGNPVNIAVVNVPNPARNVAVDASQLRFLINIPNYFITDSETGEVITGFNYYNYFPESGGGGGSITIDNFPTEGSENAVSSGGTYSFVNSSVSTNTANFIGTFSSVEDLEAYSGEITNNDYAFVIGIDANGNTKYDRYKYTDATDPASWEYEYTLNNSSFTAAEWATIQSGLTSSDKEKIDSAAGKKVEGVKFTRSNGTTVTAGAGAEQFNNYGTNQSTDSRVNIPSGISSHAEGSGTTASASYSHTEGYNTKASGTCSHAEGSTTIASANNSHAEGYKTIASGFNSHAEGSETTASGENSHAEGIDTIASGTHSHAEGHSTASGMYSHAEGYGTKASGSYQHAAGIFNIEDSSDKYAHIIGNGTAYNSRSNAYCIDWNGKIYQPSDPNADANGVYLSSKATKATTLAGYGITDAKFTPSTGTIQLGSNTLVPVTTIQINGTAQTNTNGTVDLPAYPTTLPASDTTNTYNPSGTVPVSGQAVASAISTKADLSMFTAMSEADYEALVTKTNPLYFIYED